MAALEKQSMGVMNSWLERIRDVYRLHQNELDAIPDKVDRGRRMVELNVVEQCLNLYKTDAVQKRRLETYYDPNEPAAYPRIHALVFDPKSGILKKLPIDFKAEIARYRDIYDLYDQDPRLKNAEQEEQHYMLKKKSWMDGSAGKP